MESLRFAVFISNDQGVEMVHSMIRNGHNVALVVVPSITMLTPDAPTLPSLKEQKVAVVRWRQGSGGLAACLAKCEINVGLV